MAAPAQPTAILRGHRTQVHAAAFVRVGSGGRSELRLATGDADGFVVLWDLATVRPRGVWRAHASSILGIGGWMPSEAGEACQLATHGRDHRWVLWQLGAADEQRLSTAAPLEGEAERPAPWMVHVLEVNTMNFCAFSWCGHEQGRLVAVPNALTLEAADILHLPSQQRVNTVRLGAKEGMLMALALFHRGPQLVLIAGFENGAAVVATLDAGPSGPATVRYRAQPHQQPVLSLDVAPDQSYFVTSGADAVLAKHPVPGAPGGAESQMEGSTKNAKDRDGQADSQLGSQPTRQPATQSLLSAALAKEKPPLSAELQTQPLTTLDTHHAGQQGLRLRQDGRLFATAGWDGRARVYSAKTLREVAVLKWHQSGCFAVAFAPAAEEEPGTALQTQLSVRERRLRHAATAHWVAVGGKDGKVSLWDIF